ncbi:Uncharacterised protein [uncultured archaeon]|nr:Uncharacterised protein [uncultured archaeon]
MLKPPFGNNIESVSTGEDIFDMVDFEAAFVEREMAGSLSDLNEVKSEWQNLGCPKYKAEDELLAYSVNALIREFDPENKGKLFQTRFYKLLFLLSDGLKDEGIDLKLPYFWYKHGPVVPYFLLPLDNIEMIVSTWKKFSGKFFVIAKPRSFNIQNAIKDVIDNSICNLRDQYNYSTTKTIINDVYLKAPHEFQRKYKNFYKHIEHKLCERDKLAYLKQPLKETEDIKRLEEAVNLFEEIRFPQVYNDLLQWRLIVKYSMNELERIDPEFMKCLADIFWSNLFSRYLQVQEYENMPEAMIKSWKKQLPQTHKSYRREFRKFEYKFYSDVYKPANCIDDSTRRAYNECIKPLLK